MLMLVVIPNLDALPTVIINGDSLLTPQVNHITKGRCLS
jgi:hypothetical protein